MKLLFSILLILSFRTCGQNVFEYPKEYKTFKDSSFEIGDRIISPRVVYPLRPYPLHTDTNDSVRSIAEFIDAHPDLKFEIACYTDTRGSDKSNEILSQKRAEQILTDLVKYFGTDSNQITSTTGFGESFPLISDEEISKMETEQERETAHQINRRTELIVTEKNN
jgi:peptidoglycan-associated lipoprotein